MKSASTLTTLYLHRNELLDFPFETLSQYTVLTSFSLYDNPLPSFPAIESDTLSTLYLGDAVYNTIPAGALDSLPNMESFFTQNLYIDSMATGLFRSLHELRNIHMRGTALTHLDSQQFGVNSSVIDLIALQNNHIATVDNEAFNGVQSGTINLINNKLTILPEDTWGLLIDAGVHLQLQGNELLCGCDVAWLVLEPTYHELVEDAVCHSGEKLVDLDPIFFINFC
ncbi:unnamed protein product [Meganyctiphanes norvegica]|uniref:Uncharacterized protein n=1 Tax=Meganyctiphanes norvegica TaxID=48144 RepID=A0AAV2RJ49_MEGNR